MQIANADPLNLAGILLPGPRVSTLAIGGHMLNPTGAARPITPFR